jgi:hypothetical protein
MLVVAREVTIGVQVVVLRDEAGLPTWPVPSVAAEQPRVSIVAISRDGLATTDGLDVQVHGFTLDPQAGEVVASKQTKPAFSRLREIGHATRVAGIKHC